MEVGLVRSVDIDQEMQQAYLDYAMSVIVARALPDARDGMKPVHRRILYAMFDMGLRPETAFKKSARIVGEVLGKYHPHGDMAVYEAMARMAQDFSMRCLLVEGQGNFGSVDGDPPAAMRYTEARLAAPAMHLLADIRKNTVNFSDNFDGSLTEPDVLPAALPNLLVNGATGIAVGMSTSIPPHNLGEVVDALNHMLSNWDNLDDVNVGDLMRFIHGPDFPTGGIIIPGEGEESLESAYGSGRGRVTVQARAHLEEMNRGRNRIIITELPYMTNKSSLIERIAELVRNGRLEGLADLRDESDRHGLRIVIELTKTAEPDTVLKDLFMKTPMRSTFGIIMLALVDGEPRMLSLKQALRVYLDHRLVVIKRRAEFELQRLHARAHILEGLRVALKNLDQVIDIIRKAADADAARDRLMKRFKLSEIQAQAILDMQLRRLAALERKKIEEEFKEVLAEIKNLEVLLRSSVKMRQMVSDELTQVKEAFADRRRTHISHVKAGNQASAPLLTASDLVPEKIVWVSAMPDGLISRSLDEKPPRLSGNAAPLASFQASTRHTLYIVAANGEAAAIPVLSLPEAESPDTGTPKHKVSPLSEQDQVVALFALPPKDERTPESCVFTATHQGQVKKTAISELPGPAAPTFTLVKVNEGDRLGWVRLTSGQDEVLLATADGMAIRFKEDDVRPMGLVTAGVGGIKLGARDVLIGMDIVPLKGEFFFITTDGKGKRVAADQFPIQSRNGMGVLVWKLPRSTQLAGLASGKPTTRLTLHLNRLAPKALHMEDAPLQNRAAQGKTVIELKPGDLVSALTVPGYTNGGEPEPGAETGTRKSRQRSSQAKSRPAQGIQVTFDAFLEAVPPIAVPVKTGPAKNAASVPIKATPKLKTPPEQKTGEPKKTTPKAPAKSTPAAKRKTSTVKPKARLVKAAANLRAAADKTPASAKKTPTKGAVSSKVTSQGKTATLKPAKPTAMRKPKATENSEPISTLPSATKPSRQKPTSPAGATSVKPLGKPSESSTTPDKRSKKREVGSNNK